MASTLPELKIGPKTIYKEAQCLKQRGSPKFAPLGPPLTFAQATQLVNNSFPTKSDREILAPYRQRLIELVVEKSKAIKDSERRDFKTLEKLSRHMCNQESLPGNIASIPDRVQRAKDDGVPEDMIQSVIDGTLAMTAIHIAEGFDSVNSTNFCFDENGVPIAVTNDFASRNRKCNFALKQEYQLRQFVDVQADPFKGSPQGMGRKRQRTKRRNIKRRKTRKH